MPRRLTAKQAIEMHATIHKRLARSHARAAEMVRRGEHAARDGYPATSMGGGGSGDISRPTEAEALAKPMADPTGAGIRRWAEILNRMLEDSAAIDGISANVLAIEVDERGRQSLIPDCANSWCADQLFPDRGRGGYCRPCYDFKAKHQRLPGPDEIAKRQERKDRSTKAEAS